jgi:hypothetical protein
MTLEEPPQRAPAAANSPFAQRCEQFLEGGIRLFFNKPQYRYPMFFQPGCAPSTRLWRRAARFTPMLPPFHRCAHRNPEKLGRFVPRYSGCNRFDHAFAQVSRIGFRHALTPAKENQCRKTRSSLTLCEFLDSNSPGNAVGQAFDSGDRVNIVYAATDTIDASWLH